MKSVHVAKEKAAGQLDSPHSRIFSSLVKALEQDEVFLLSDLYLLSHNDFDLALEVIKDWQLARYYMGRVKPFQGSPPSSN